MGLSGTVGDDGVSTFVDSSSVSSFVMFAVAPPAELLGQRNARPESHDRLPWCHQKTNTKQQHVRNTEEKCLVCVLGGRGRTRGSTRNLHGSALSNLYIQHGATHTRLKCCLLQAYATLLTSTAGVQEYRYGTGILYFAAQFVRWQRAQNRPTSDASEEPSIRVSIVGIISNKPGEYCADHKKDGMVSILGKRCGQQGCTKLPSF